MTASTIPEPGALIRHHTVGHVVGTYHDAVGKMREAIACIYQQQARINEAFGSDSDNLLEPSEIDFGSPDRSFDAMQRRAWRRIVNLAGIRQMMSIKAAEDLDRMLEHEKLPDLTEENVTNMLRTAQADAGKHIAEAVREVHAFLRPQNGRYVTNTRCDVGRKVIIGGMVTTAYTAGAFRVSYGGRPEQRLRALDNVLLMLDGKGVIKSHCGPTSDAISASPDGTGETEYVKFRCCKNGNLHLEFKRGDLIDRLNAIAAGNNLYSPDDRRRANR